MGVNNVNNNGSVMIWSSDNSVRKGEKIDFANTSKPANADRFVLNLPISETVYKRQEFVTNEKMGEDCAYCYTYMERTLNFGDFTISSSSADGYFVINKDGQKFGKSGADMNNIEHAAEETIERINRALEQSSLSAGMSGAVTENGQTASGSLEFEMRNTVYKYSSVSETKGAVSYKNGGKGIYRVRAATNREIYNKCAVFLAEAFGKNGSELLLSKSAFNELFRIYGKDEKTVNGNAEQKRENTVKPLENLRRFMENNLAEVRENYPDCGSLKTFADTCLKLGEYEYSGIASVVEKMFAASDIVYNEK